MLIVVSPAKRLADPPARDDLTDPVFAAEARALADLARELDETALARLMRISPALAALNVARFAAFGSQPRGAAVLTFAGDTYAGLEAATLGADEMRWAQDRLSILSGLYGLLRPLDAIEPYRLEMGSRLRNRRGRTLYDWWGDRIARQLTARARQTGARALVNCASEEYFRAVDRAALDLPVISPVFMEAGADGPRIVSFHAKRARGAMARFIVQHRLEDPRALRDFDAGGYAFRPDLSAPERPVFVRGAEDGGAAP